MYLLLALFVACNKPQPEPVVAEPEPLPFEFDENLQNIDTLLQHDAATALQELLSSDTLPVIFNKNYHQLLLSEALYKTDNPQLNRFAWTQYAKRTRHATSLQAAMRFFDSLAVLYPTNDDLTVLSARSHYMNGVGFYENDSIVEACKEYLHTLEILENHFDVETLRGYRAKFMGLTYNRLVDLFSNQFMMEPAIYCGKKALFYCKIAPTSKYGLANSLYQVGNLYDMSNITDSASYYYKQAIEALPDSNNLVYRNIITSKALLAYNSGCDANSLLVELKQITKHIDNIDEISTRFVTIGYIYYKEKVYDSAVIYLEKAFENNIIIAAKQQSAEYLYNLNLQNGDSIKAYKYANFLAENATRQYDNMPEISALNTIFQDYLIQKQIKEKNEHMRNIKKRTWIIITCSSVTFVIIIILIVLISKKTRAIKKKSHDDLEEKDKALAEMKRKMEANPFVKEPICKYILKVVNENSFKAKLDLRAYKKFALDRNQIMMLRDAVDRHYNSFTQLLSKTYPELTFDDLDYCCLYLLGLKEADIAALMQRAYPTVCQRSRKIKRIFNTKESLQSAIAAMAFQAQCNA